MRKAKRAKSKLKLCVFICTKFQQKVYEQMAKNTKWKGATTQQVAAASP